MAKKPWRKKKKQEIEGEAASAITKRQFLADFGPLVEVVKGAARAYCEMGTGEKALGPMLHVFGYTNKEMNKIGSMVLPLAMGPGQERQETLRLLGQVAAQQGMRPAYVVLLAEAWVGSKGADGGLVRPSEQPDRKEVITALGSSMMMESVTVLVDIIRNGDEILPGAETVIEEEVRDNLLPYFFMGYMQAKGLIEG